MLGTDTAGGGGCGGSVPAAGIVLPAEEAEEAGQSGWTPHTGEAVY